MNKNRICQAFKENPEINPLTGKKIRIGGPTYNELVQLCDLNTTLEKCDQFKSNPTKNPFTGRTIQVGSNSYNQVVKTCRREHKDRCFEFTRNTAKDPFTGRKLRKNSEEQHRIQDYCRNLLTKAPKPYEHLRHKKGKVVI